MALKGETVIIALDGINSILQNESSLRLFHVIPHTNLKQSKLVMV
jgi:hypothetical protein